MARSAVQFGRPQSGPHCSHDSFPCRRKHGAVSHSVPGYEPPPKPRLVRRCAAHPRRVSGRTRLCFGGGGDLVRTRLAQVRRLKPGRSERAGLGTSLRTCRNGDRGDPLCACDHEGCDDHRSSLVLRVMQTDIISYHPRSRAVSGSGISTSLAQKREAVGLASLRLGRRGPPRPPQKTPSPGGGGVFSATAGLQPRGRRLLLPKARRYRPPAAAPQGPHRGCRFR